MNIVAPILILLFSQFISPSLDVNAVSVKQLASEQISLEKRYSDSYVNDVFKDNILLSLAYLSGKVNKKEDIDWNEIEKPFEYKFTLMPNKTFAFHEDVLDEYKSSLTKTTNAHFNFADGFKTDGYLMGDGVCHLASLMYWTAKTAGLDAYAPVNHDFAVIPQVPKEFGVSIYKMPGDNSGNARQNLYITNNKTGPVIFNFVYRDRQLTLSIYEGAL